MDMTMEQRRAVTGKLAQEYRGGDRRTKARILDTLVGLTGYTRCYAGWLLRHWGRKYWVRIDGTLVRLVVGAVRKRVPHPRARTYDEPVVKVLKLIWESFDFMCGQRLAAMIRETLPVLVGSGELYCNPRTLDKLLRISGATIDRILKAEKARRQIRGHTHTKPSSLLRAQIPIRTWSELDVQEPGHFQMDLVGHDGGNSRGEFAYSLDCVELFSGWIEPCALPNRAHRGVCRAAEELRLNCPIPLKSLHSDSGGEFLNTQLLGWCERHHIAFSRSRPYRKNDTCFVEQKNYNVIRQAVGYARFDSEQEVELIAQLYAPLRLLVNHFYPSMKLVEKKRVGSHVYKRYDKPKSPYRRLLDCSSLDPQIKERLREEHRKLRPLALKKRISQLQDQLYRLARAKYAPSAASLTVEETIEDEEVPILTDQQV